MSQIIPSNPAISQAVSQGLSATGTPLAAGASYSAEISRRNPTAFVFLIDQSGSMSNDTLMNGQTVSKAEAATLAVNKILNELIRRCTTNEGVLDRIFVAVIGYGQDDNEANIAWEGALEGREWVALSELQQNPLGVMEEPIQVDEDDPFAAEMTGVEVRNWFNPMAEGLTPMRSALEKAAELLRDWLTRHPHCYPPVVFNLTDGEATDGNRNQLIDAARAIKQLASSNGHVLLFNCHISSDSERRVFFPARKDELPPADNAELLFDMSSDLPPSYNMSVFELKRSKGETVRDVEETYSAMIFNGGIAEFSQMLDIGTRPTQRIPTNPA
jgi:uncharacterized protein YegL